MGRHGEKSRISSDLILSQSSCYNISAMSTKGTYQPNKTKRARVHGFRERMKSIGGRKVLKARRAKKRSKLTVSG